MVTKRIKDLTTVTGALATDQIPFDNASGQTRKVTVGQLKNYVVDELGALAQSDSVGTDQLANRSVTLAKEALGTANRLKGFDGVGNPVEVTVAGGATLDGGTLTISTVGGGATTLDGLSDVTVGNATQNGSLYGFQYDSVSGGYSLNRSPTLDDVTFVGLTDVDASGATVHGSQYGLTYSTVAGGNFTATTVSGSGATNLDGLTDVTIVSAATGQVLKYNGTAWVNDTVAGGSLSLDGLSDVTITTPSSGHVVKYNGTAWVNDTVAGAGNLDSLSDVAITTPASGQTLVYNGSTWANSTVAGGTGISQTDVEAFSGKWATGLVGDGVTDDTVALQAIFDNVPDKGVIVFPPGKTIRITSKIDIDAGRSFTMIARGVTFYADNFSPMNSMFIAKGQSSASNSNTGGWDRVDNVSAVSNTAESINSVTRYTATLTFSTAGVGSNYKVGDRIKIVSDDVIPDGGDAGTDFVGDATAHRVASWASVLAVSANSIEVTPLPRDYGFTTNVRVARPLDIYLRIIGGTYKYDYADVLAADSDKSCIQVYHYKYFHIQDAFFEETSGICVHPIGVATMTMQNCHANHLADKSHIEVLASPVSYLLSPTGCDHVAMNGCTGHWVRHLYTSNPYSVPTNYNPALYGSCIGHTISNCVASGGNSTAFDTHATDRGTTFIGCTALNQTGTAFAARADTVFIGCTAVNCFLSFQIFQDTLSTPFVQITGCQIRDSGYMEVKAGSNVRVSDTMFIGTQNGDSGVMVQLPQNNGARLTMENCEFFCVDGSSSQGVIKFQYGNTLIMRGCRFSAYKNGTLSNTNVFSIQRQTGNTGKIWLDKVWVEGTGWRQLFTAYGTGDLPAFYGTLYKDSAETTGDSMGANLSVLSLTNGFPI